MQRERRQKRQVEAEKDEFGQAADGVPRADQEVAVKRAGTGLAGIAERAALLSGACEAGPRPDGGFRLRVTLEAPR